MQPRYLKHLEELTALWPDVQPDRGRIKPGHGIQPWWRAPQPKRGVGLNNGPGYGRVFIQSPRNQRVFVQGISFSNGPGRRWYNHGIYLQRHSANTEGAIGRGFNGEQEKIDLKTMLSQWQREHDRHVFKVILSPEQSKELDLKVFTRRVMREVERDLGKPLHWAAIDHYNTNHPHVHVLIRGVSESQVLTVARMYLQEGIRERAQEVATHMLGPRTRQEVEQGYERALERESWTLLDQSIKTKMYTDRMVDDVRLSPYEQRRMEQLDKRELAWKVGDQWRMSIYWETKQMSEHTPERKPQEQEQAPQQPDVQKKEQARKEQEQEGQHQRATIVNDVEQDLGWDR